jgi:hypothetical protein
MRFRRRFDTCVLRGRVGVNVWRRFDDACVVSRRFAVWGFDAGGVIGSVDAARVWVEEE